MKKRTQTFLGIHFDFHALRDYKIGGKYDEKQIDDFLSRVKPDFIQVDSKGHPGVASFPTPYGMHAQIVEDVMPIWRKLTKKHDVALLAHYSGVQDDEAIIAHPEWAVINKDGTSDVRATSLFSSYVDERLIPELKLLAGKYGFNGAWVDGECWGTKVDYSENAKKAYKEKYGVEPDLENNFMAYVDFCRDSFWEYTKHYVTEIKKEYPDFQITSNWAMSSQSPSSRRDLAFEFLSGDLAPQNSVRSAKLESRMLEQNRKPWDLMAWSFTIRYADGLTTYKSAVQLKQELAHVLSMGGGVQIYLAQQPEKGINNAHMIDVVEEVAKFCREREEFCHQKNTVKETCLLFSEKAYYDEHEDVPFHDFRRFPYMADFVESIYLLTDCGYHVTNSMIERDEDLSKYQTVVLTNVQSLTEEQTKKLLEYVKAGGNLVVAGDKSCKLFAPVVGVNVVDTKDKYLSIEVDGELTKIKVDFTELEDSVNTDSKCYDASRKIFDEIESDKYYPASVEKVVGDGRICLIPFEIGKAYGNVQDPVFRKFVQKSIVKEPIATIEGVKNVDAVLLEDNDKLFVNLINNNGSSDITNPVVFDYVAPAYDFTVNIKSAVKPKKVIVQPDGKKLKFNYSNGIVSVNIDKLEIHTIIELDY